MNKEEVLHFITKEEACDSAIDWFIEQDGTLEEIYNGCHVDWRIWLHDLLRLDPDPYQKYSAVVGVARKQYESDSTTEAYAIYTKIEDTAWDKWRAETMKNWGIVEKVLQERIGNDQNRK